MSNLAYENQVWHLAVSGTGRVVCVETSVARARTCAKRAEERTGQQHFVRQVSGRTAPAVGSRVILRSNPTRVQNIVIGSGLGVLGGGLLLGFPGALVGFGVGAYAGAQARPTRRALLENQRRRRRRGGNGAGRDVHGPFVDRADARDTVKVLRDLGITDARIVRDAAGEYYVVF